MSSVMVLASDVPLEAFVSPSEKPVVLSEDTGGTTVSIRFEDDFAVWPSEGYLEIPTKKEYFADLAIYNPDCGGKVAGYLKNLLKTAPELELWHVWPETWTTGCAKRRSKPMSSPRRTSGS